MRERLSALPVSELREIAKANGIKLHLESNS